MNGKNHGQGFGMNKAPLSHVIASGSQEGLSNAGTFLPAPGSEGRVNRIWHLQTRKNYMGLFILTRSPGFQQICTINALFRFPSLFFFFLAYSVRTSSGFLELLLLKAAPGAVFGSLLPGYPLLCLQTQSAEITRDRLHPGHHA